VFARVIRDNERPCGGTTHVLGTLDRLKITLIHLGPSGLST